MYNKNFFKSRQENSRIIFGKYQKKGKDIDEWPVSILVYVAQGTKYLLETSLKF